MWTLYTSGHIHSVTVIGALAAGTGLPMRQTPCALEDGGMVTYGALRGLRPLWRQAQHERRDFVYVDNGYFRPSAHGRRDYSGYYRATRNAVQHDGSGNADPHRFEMLGKRLMPWRKDGRQIMVCPPGQVYAGVMGFDAQRWLTDTLRALRAATDRPLLVRDKRQAGAVPLWEALRDVHALVTHSSNAAVEALLYGVPVFCTAPCAAQAMGCGDLGQIEKPLYPEREQWAWNLAANQWTLAEMKSGQAWRELNA